MALIEIEKFPGFRKIKEYIGNLVRRKSDDVAVNDVGGDASVSNEDEKNELVSI